MTGLDSNELVAALSHTFSSDANERQSAERYLDGLAAQSALVPVALLDVVVESRLRSDIRLASAVRVKRLIAARFARRSDEPAPADLPAEHLALLRHRLLSSVVSTSLERALRVQLVDAANYMIRADFPDRWPDLVDLLVPALQSARETDALGALHILRQVYRRVQHERHWPCALLERTLPLVIRLADVDGGDLPGMLARSDPQAAVFAERLRVALKIFHHCIRQPVPPAFLGADVFRPVASICLRTLQAVSGSDAVLAAQKRALVVLCPLLRLYGRGATDPADVAFARLYMQEVAPPLLASVLQIVTDRPHACASRRILQASFAFLGTAITFGALYAPHVRPHLTAVIAQGVARTLALDADQVALFEADGAEFTRAADETFDDPAINAANLVVDLVRVRTRDALPVVLSTISACVGANNVDPIRIDAGLHLFGCVSRVLCGNDDRGDVEATVDAVIAQAVLPALAHASPIVRARAAWCLGRYASRPPAPHLLPAIVDLLRGDAHVPVRAAASTALIEVLQAHPTLALAALPVALPDLIGPFVDLVDVVASETVLSVLEDLLRRLPRDAVAPFAVPLAAKLVDVFARAAFAPDNDDDDDGGVDDRQFIAGGAVRVLMALVGACATTTTSPGCYAAVEAQCLPVVDRVLSCPEHAALLLDDILDLVRALARACSDPLSPFLLGLPGRLLALVRAPGTAAADYLPTMVPVLRTVLARSPATLSATAHDIVDVCHRAMQGDDAAHDGRYAADLLEALVALLPEPADEVVVGAVLRTCQASFLRALPDAADDFTTELYLQVLLHPIAYSAIRRPDVVARLTAPAFYHAWATTMPALHASSTAELSLAALASLATADPALPIVARIPALCRQIAREMHDDDEDDDDDGRETGRSAPAPLRGGKFRDVDLDQDWDSDDPDDEYVEEDEEDEEEEDDDDVLRDLDLRAVFMERLAAAGNGQVVARLSDADRRDVQLYLDAASKQQQQQAAAAAH